MKVQVIPSGGRSIEALRRVDRPDPEPGHGQIVVRVRAASLNYRDQAVITGNYFGGVVQQDLVPLSDGAGEVVAVGAGVTRFRTGDRVAGTFFLGWNDGPPGGPYPARGAPPVDGMLAEYVLLDEQDAVRIPSNLSFEQAATLPCAGATAWHALVETCGVRPGDTVLALGTGGVANFALLFGRAAGARVILTSSSDEKLERARALGAWAGINYRHHPDWEKELLGLTDGAGATHVIETGGAGTLAKSMQAVAYGGHIALIGVLAGFTGDTNPHPLLRKGAHMHGIFVASRATFERMNAAIEADDLQPVVDRVFDFEQAAEAYRYQQSGALFGKVVIRIP
jgi:NADPH:quinone reductase-like Zn-dependent oxidoreductase